MNVTKLVAFLMIVTPGVAFAGSPPGPEIGTLLVAEQTASSPSMAKPVDLMVNKMVRKGDRLVTGPFGKMFVRFKDGSELSLGAEGDITLDDLIFDPDDEAANKFNVTVVGGAFRYVSGQIAQLNSTEVTLKTPLATIGIRGTHVLAIVDENYAGCIVLLETPNAKGKPSSITVTANGQSVVIDRPGWGTEVTGKNTSPTKPRTWPRDRIMKMLKMSGSDPALLK